MKSLQFVTDGNNSDPKKEFMLLQAIADINLNDYAIVDTTFDDEGNTSNLHKHVYRFPDKKVKANDYVAVYSGIGKQNSTVKNNHTFHIFYMNLNVCVWNDDTLDKLEVWQVKTVLTQKIKRVS